jgi:biopolymer transport protein ExbD
MKRFEQINVIPFIDIMLVLLAIVLTTATFIVQGVIDVELPDARSRESLPQEPHREITIDAEHRLYYGEEMLNLATLGERLKALSPETPILLRVDQAVPFEHFVAVIDLLKTNRLEHLSIVTRQAR